MPNSPYYYLIQRYFPPEQWPAADCITMAECPSQDPIQVVDQGQIDCGVGGVAARAWGLFGILDACWDPALKPTSPFTQEQWAQVLDPNVNTWMASVIWSRSGWGVWTTCADCQVCDVVGGTIPHPEGPVVEAPRGVSWLPFALLGAAFVGLVVADGRRGR